MTAKYQGLSESDRIYARGLEADASLARHRARKHREAGRELQASIQDDIAAEKDRELIGLLGKISH